MKRFLLCLGLIYSVVFNSYSQQIQGYVLFQADKMPVSYGSVVLKTLPDSGFVSGVITYDQGQYTFDNVKPGAYVLIANYMGYSDSYVDVEIGPGQKIVTPDTIYLHESINKIEEVQVTGDFIRGEELVDRTVYQIPPEVASSSTDGYEVLRKLPSVQVDFNNNITLDGSSNFIIQVDGKERDKEFLARISPDDIKSVEIIHNPSGKYDGSVDGVINVLLTSQARMGVSGNMALVVKPINKFFAFGNAGLDYGREKITYYISGYSFKQSLATKACSQYHFYEDNISDSLINSQGEGDFSVLAGAINTGFDYYIDDKHNLSLNYSYKPNKMKTQLENEGLIYVSDILEHEQEYSNSSETKSGESTVSLYFRKKFKKPIQELTFENSLYWFSSDEDNDFSTNLFSTGNSESIYSTSYLESIINERQYFKSKLDYVQPLGSSMRMETGYQFYYQQMLFDTDNSIISLSNDFNYNEYRNAVYLSWMWNIKKFGFMATARGEYSDILINDTTPTDYFSILPTINIQYKINGSQNIKLTYNRRISRPDIYQLNPFEKLNNYQFISSGNPYLDPEYKDKFELKYSINFKKNFITPYLYHTIITNKISTVNQLEDLSNESGTILTTRPENVLSGYEQGFGFNSMLWYFKVDGKLFKGHYNDYDNVYTQIDAQDYYSYNVTAFSFWQPIKDTLTLFGFLMYQGVKYEAQSKTYSNPVYGFGGQYKLNNHTFSVNWVFPGTKDFIYSKTVTETDQLYSEAKSSFDVRFFIQFIYSYSFNKGKSVRKIGHKTDVESDTKSSGIQN